ncbi:TolC family outer membrane protein [Novosphingobium sp.]|uniref:TolC family outer membrane protein n=1 Tax=Novosphingobium sp. TaxID=1874826 RepID=UPI003B5276AA
MAGSSLARIASLLALIGLADFARAEDLRSALAAAYRSNPTLAASRDELKVADETVSIARADGLPSANLSGSATDFLKRNPLVTPNPARSVTVSGGMSVPLYMGGAVHNAVRAAQVRVEAGRADLGGSESTVFSQVVGAYVDVLLGSETVRAKLANVKMLRANLQSAQGRWELGDVTSTDVAQSQSRLALAEGDWHNSESNLVAAQEKYVEIVGGPAYDLQSPPPLPGLPVDVDDAVEMALNKNPDLAAARARARAAGYDVHVASASRLPKLSLFADGQRDNYLGSLPSTIFGSLANAVTTADVGVRATIPLLTGGRPGAQVRQAHAQEAVAFDQEMRAQRSIIYQVRAAFAAFVAAKKVIASTQIALDAARLGLEGVQAENSAGSRTILDILNAEQELVNAEVQLATARRNAYVAGFTLLAAMGRTQAKDLGLDGGPLFEPDLRDREMRSESWNWGQDPMPNHASPDPGDPSYSESSISAN